MSNEDKASRVTRCRYSKVNTLFATLNNTLLGYNIFPGHLNGDVYHQFLTNQLFQILEDIPLAVRQRLWYMQDGAPPHSTRECLRWMHEHFPNRWIGRGAEAPIHWPPRSPDLNPLDFTVWGQIKSKVYATPVDNRQELLVRIQNAFHELSNGPLLQDIMFSLEKRLRTCIRVNGGHFEQLIN